MRAVVEVNLKAIAHNIKQIKSLTKSEILAVVKADAYGHGLVPVAKQALISGASWLGVALLEEALALRASGITAPVIAWLTPPGEDFSSALKENIDLSVSSISLFEEILGVGKVTGIKPRLHFEIDTGMRRGGVLDEWSDFLAFAKEHSQEYELVGVWSHFARADEPDSTFNAVQENNFELKLADVKLAGLSPKIVHLSNSAATITNPAAHHLMVRLGIAMYGLSPDVNTLGTSQDLYLIPAMTVKAKIHLVKSAKKGEAVGYGGTAILGADSKLAVIVMGYADGLPRSASNIAGVLHNSKKAPLIGRVSMDQCVVNLGADSTAKAGDYVTIFGADGYSADDWGKASGTINYEITTRIASRVPRIYT
jgi:alanine racemase